MVAKVERQQDRLRSSMGFQDLVVQVTTNRPRIQLATILPHEVLIRPNLLRGTVEAIRALNGTDAEMMQSRRRVFTIAT